MADIRAGTRLKASTLNAIAPMVTVLTSSIIRTSTVTPSATAVAVTPLVAGATYAIRGWVPYTAPTAGDLRLALVGPAGSSGRWSVFGLTPTASTGYGDIVSSAQASYTAGLSVVVGAVDGGDLSAEIVGSITIGPTAGTLTLHAAQGTANATPATVHAGAWLSVLRLN
jgi:hypothetical protein